MAQVPQQQIQVLQSLSGTQFQQMYMPQQQMVYAGHLAGSTLQNMGPAPGVSYHMQPKGSLDSKTYEIHNMQPHQRTVVLQPKSHYTSLPVHSTVQVLNGSNLNQIPQRQVISSQPSAPMYSQPQMMGSYALSPLPPGYSWASTSYSPQSPFIIRTPQPNIYIQHPQPQTTFQMPVHAAPQAVQSLSISEVYEETHPIATETLHPNVASSTISCSSIPTIISSDGTETLSTVIPKESSTNQANLYSTPRTYSRVPRYSQSFIPNQVNQSIETVPQNQPNQFIDSSLHNQANQLIDSVTHVQANQSTESVVHNPVNSGVIHDQSNQCSESPNTKTVDQYTELPTYNQGNQSTESVIFRQDEETLESPNRCQLNHYVESQVNPCSVFVGEVSANIVDSKQLLTTHTESEMKTEQPNKVLNPPLLKEQCLKIPSQETHEMEDLSAQDSLPSTSFNIPTSIAEPMVTATSLSSSSPNTSTVQSNSMKSFVETYSYTVVSPTSDVQSDMLSNKDNSQKLDTDFYPIIKLKRLKPQDPLGKQDLVDKHPQKAIVKPQMLAPDSTPELFPESMKSLADSSPDVLSLKRKLPEEIDSFPVQTVRARGRGRPRKTTITVPKTPVKSKTLPKPKTPARPKTPVLPKAPETHVTPEKEVVENSVQEIRRSVRKKNLNKFYVEGCWFTGYTDMEHRTRHNTRRQKDPPAKIEIIEIADDNNDIAKMASSDSPSKNLRVRNTSMNESNDSLNDNSETQDTDDSRSTVTTHSNLEELCQASKDKDNIVTATTSGSEISLSTNRSESTSSALPSTSKAISFDSGSCDLKGNVILETMSVQEVCEFVCGFPGCSEYGEVFKTQEIDGQALLLLNLDHLMTGFCMRLGPAVKLISYISSQKGEDI